MRTDLKIFKIKYCRANVELTGTPGGRTGAAVGALIGALVGLIIGARVGRIIGALVGLLTGGPAKGTCFTGANGTTGTMGAVVGLSEVGSIAVVGVVGPNIVGTTPVVGTGSKGVGDENGTLSGGVTITGTCTKVGDDTGSMEV